ncbi:MAG: sulfate ABC transporter substrate-binding protein [Polyangiales bacterium]
MVPNSRTPRVLRMLRQLLWVGLTCWSVLTLGACAKGGRGQPKLLVASFDATRELNQEIDHAFAETWKSQTGETLTIESSHGGSSKQARAVIEGLDADVVSLGLSYDVDLIARAGLIHQDWQGTFPQRSAPFVSTIVFLVRAGNPKAILDWDDLLRANVSVITANPKTSSGARWVYLAALGHALSKYRGDLASQRAQAFVSELYAHVPVLDVGSRAATTTFMQHGLGDVLVGWENEAMLAMAEGDAGRFQIVIPPLSIRAEPAVALVDKVVDAHGSRGVAQAYVSFLYSARAQEIASRHFFRPQLAGVAATASFPKVAWFTVDEVFGGWAHAQEVHFSDGGVFDQIYRPRS